MSAKKSKLLRCHTDFLFVAQQAYLNNRMPRGLFEACNGNKYLVVQDSDEKYAIILSHAHRPAFTHCDIKRRPLEYGTWWGRSRLRLTNAVKGRGEAAPGILKIEDSWVLLSCFDSRGSLQWCPIGWGAGNAAEGMKFDGWGLEAEEVDYDFFHRLPNGECGGGELCIDVSPECPWFMNVELDIETDD